MTAENVRSARACWADNCAQQILCKILCCLFLLSLQVSACRSYSPSVRVSIHPSTTPPRWKVAPAMPYAPLRLITSRKLNVFTHERGFPRLFSVIDTLECGHEYTSCTWTFLDLVNAYTENPDVSARRRRCHACAALEHTHSRRVAAARHEHANQATKA